MVECNQNPVWHQGRTKLENGLIWANPAFASAIISQSSAEGLRWKLLRQRWPDCHRAQWAAVESVARGRASGNSRCVLFDLQQDGGHGDLHIATSGACFDGRLESSPRALGRRIRAYSPQVPGTNLFGCLDGRTDVLSMLLYLSYAEVLPYSTGELVYVSGPIIVGRLQSRLTHVIYRSTKPRPT